MRNSGHQRIRFTHPLHSLCGANSGFSLIEMLVAVAVIAILVSLAVPNYTQSTKAANEASAISNIRTLGSAQALYHNGFGQYASSYDQLATAGFMAIASESTGYLLSVSGDGSSWTALAQPQSPGVTGDRYFYLGDRRATCCCRGLASGPTSFSTPCGGAWWRIG